MSSNSHLLQSKQMKSRWTEKHAIIKNRQRGFLSMRAHGFDSYQSCYFANCTALCFKTKNRVFVTWKTENGLTRRKIWAFKTTFWIRLSHFGKTDMKVKNSRGLKHRFPLFCALINMEISNRENYEIPENEISSSNETDIPLSSVVNVNKKTLMKRVCLFTVYILLVMLFIQ